MRYYRSRVDDEVRLIARRQSQAYDLTSVYPELKSLTDLLSASKLTGNSLDGIAERLTSEAKSVPVGSLESKAKVPIVADEIWAAGVTYEISEKAREEESTLPEIYAKVYESPRPELFFKASPGRTVGPNDSIGVRTDSEWNVPEPELGIVLFEESIIGYTIGNDVSSRDLEGENPLYLPQAKVYDRCCSIGPCVVSAESINNPHDLAISMTITRDGESIFEGKTSTADMVRTCDELVSYYQQSNSLPRTSILLTGTSLVPEEVNIQEDDVVEIQIESIGTLRNPVLEV